MNSKLFLFALCCFFITGSDANCVTPNRVPGTCMSLALCPSLLAMLQEIPISNTSLDFLRQSQCKGFVGHLPNMCCPSSSSPNAMRPDASKSHYAPMVDHHVNLRLINSRTCGMGETSRIRNGIRADMNEFPWMALLGYTDGSGATRYGCTGSLINNLYVLTAAHCIDSTLTAVLLGEYDTSTDPDCEEVYGGRLCASSTQSFTVGNTIVHTGYLGTPLTNDIALVRLSRPADLERDSVRPICLPVGASEQERNLFGTTMIISGWGISLNESARSTILLKTQFPIMQNVECNEIVRTNFNYVVTERQLCVGGVGVARNCSGDGGGPMIALSDKAGVAKYVQFGVASTAITRCPTADLPAVYTRIGHYMNWILDTIQP